LSRDNEQAGAPSVPEGRPEVVMAPAQQDDGETLARLWSDAFKGQLEYMLGEATCPVLTEWFQRDQRILDGTTLARVDGTAVGYIQVSGKQRVSVRAALSLITLLWRHFGLTSGIKRLIQMSLTELQHRYGPKDLYVLMLGVAAPWRGHGVGTRLLAFAEQEARQHGKTGLSLTVDRHNPGARRLYERSGFVAGPLQHFRFEQWADGTDGYYMMRKTLD